MKTNYISYKRVKNHIAQCSYQKLQLKKVKAIKVQNKSNMRLLQPWTVIISVYNVLLEYVFRKTF